jgi:hypothetical protein
MLSVYEINAKITIPRGGEFVDDVFTDALGDWESIPQKQDQQPSVVLDAYLKHISPVAKTARNPQRGADETLDHYLGFIWPPAKLPKDFGSRQICEIEFTDGSERKGQAEVTRRVISAKTMMRRNNDGGDRIEVRFASQLRGVK